LGPRIPLATPERALVFGFQPDVLEPRERETFESTQLVRDYDVAAVAADPSGSAERALTQLSRDSARYLLHFDVDVVDYIDFPVAEVPHFDGLPYGKTIECLDVFLAGEGLAGVVITEFNALQDPDGAHARRFLDDFVPRLAAAVSPPS
jgi:arginase